MINKAVNELQKKQNHYRTLHEKIYADKMQQRETNLRNLISESERKRQAANENKVKIIMEREIQKSDNFNRLLFEENAMRLYRINEYKRNCVLAKHYEIQSRNEQSKKMFQTYQSELHKRAIKTNKKLEEEYNIFVKLVREREEKHSPCDLEKFFEKLDDKLKLDIKANKKFKNLKEKSTIKPVKADVENSELNNSRKHSKESLGLSEITSQ